ncbi:hypothetical protein AVEN_82478-1 [Araneus ventricosus]|uniref:Uncharacterized protein n=1 Tax=Araneus ventricosus TaxID=182803 RepID=A0A4Y2KT99_ARAVE|nr:hypothetical protein AVEN_82478-1 [Araneus ventricosus]
MSFPSSPILVDSSAHISNSALDTSSSLTMTVSFFQIKLSLFSLRSVAFESSSEGSSSKISRASAIGKKRLRNIADNADIKAHNLYLNHTQATPNAEYADYEDEETDCSSDISEVILNLNTYKPSTSNRLISLTDPKYKQLTLFVAKSSQMRLGLPSTPVVGDRCGVSDRAVAAIASSVLPDVGLITSNNSDLVVDENKLRREKRKLERI